MLYKNIYFPIQQGLFIFRNEFIFDYLRPSFPSLFSLCLSIQLHEFSNRMARTETPLLDFLAAYVSSARPL